MKKIIFIITSLCLLAGCQNGHLDIFPALKDDDLMTQKLTVAQMHADIDALVDGAIARHPDIEQYANVEQLTHVAQQLKSTLSEPLNRVEFYRVVGKLTPYFRDGHSLLIWPYQELNQARDEGHKTFPLAVTFSSSGLLQLKHAYKLKAQSIPKFTEVRSINGIASDVIVDNLKQYSAGETPLLRRHAVALRFGVMLWASYGWLNHFEVELLTSSGVQKVVLDLHQNWPTVDAHDQGAVAHSSVKARYYQRLTDDVGFIYIADFDVEPNEFSTFIDQTFATIGEQGIRHLIIDVRDNPGGNTDTVTYLARHLAAEPFRLISKLKEKLNNDNRGWFNYKGDVGETLTTSWDDWESPIAEHKRFKGQTYLLIGPATYSAAIVLATTLKDQNMATLVGEVTGGFANQSAQGNLFNLPNSQLRAYITTRLLVRPSGDMARRGVVPHYDITEYNFGSCVEAQQRAHELALREQGDKSLKLIALLLSDGVKDCKKVRSL